MKKQLLKILTFIFAFVSLLSAAVPPASALEWSGDASGAGGNASGIVDSGFAISSASDNLAGYRFSVVDKSGNTRNGQVIDVFRSTSDARLAYYLTYSTWGHKFVPKYNKVQWIAKQNSGYSSKQTQANTLMENVDIFFESAIPLTTGIEDWIQKGTNLNAILKVLGISSVHDLNGGDKVLAEPLYFIRINNKWHTMTVTEIGVFGKSKFGGNSSGGNVFEPGHWGYIKKYANRIYPNSLHETTGADGLWEPAPGFSDGYGTFQLLINYGYGVGIAYKVDDTASYTINYNANGDGDTAGSTPSSTHELGVAKPLSANGYTREYHIFKGWNTKPDGSGKAYSDKQSVKDLVDEPGTTITLYAQWEIDPVIKIEFIEPNASYREGVTVISSFNVINETEDRDFIPSDNVRVEFTVHNGSERVYKATQTAVVIPKNDKNLVFFKWTVPSGLGGSDLKVTGEVYLGDLHMDKYSKTVDTSLPAKYETGATKFDREPWDTWQGIPNAPSAQTPTSASWSVWVYKDTRFVKETYRVAAATSECAIKPDTDAPSYSDDSSLKSGYGFGISWTPKVTSSGSTFATADMYTLPQSVSALFPEFDYKKGGSECRSLENVDGSFCFKENDEEGEGDRLHFTPLWYPNGTANYTVYIHAYDCWTPAGMIYFLDKAPSLSITGSLYDDYFIGRKDR